MQATTEPVLFRSEEATVTSRRVICGPDTIFLARVTEASLESWSVRFTHAGFVVLCSALPLWAGSLILLGSDGLTDRVLGWVAFVGCPVALACLYFLRLYRVRYPVHLVVDGRRRVLWFDSKESAQKAHWAISQGAGKS